MQSIADTEVYPGQVLAGKFRIERILGRGGMGVVVAATHLQLDEKVALKFLLPEALKNPEAVRRFEREARAAVKIKSEHVARVTDVGTLETGAPYMVMEFLHGMDLGQYLQERGSLPLEEAVEYLLQAIEAIAEAHSLGIIHRDLKPANLYRILRSDGSASIKVLDFGISKVTTGDDASMTHTSSMMGSPYYMSPEQMTSAKNVDQRTDIWALGIILHELLTGNVPYDGETIPEVCAKVLQNPPPQLDALRPDLPRELEVILGKALEKKRDDRYRDVAHFALALSAYANHDGRRSVERISKVLGVVPTSAALSNTNAQNSASLSDSALAQNGSAHEQRGSEHASGFGSPTSNSAATHHATGKNLAVEPTTLGGAAHTQLDYKPPTSSVSRKTLLLAVGGLLLIGAGIFALVSGNKQSVAQESLVATDSEPSENAESKSSAGPQSPDSQSDAPPAESAKTGVAPQAPSAPEPGTDEANPHKTAPANSSTRPTQAGAVQATTTTPAKPPPQPRPSSVTSASTPPPARPTAAPAPAVKPPPAPSPNNLYLDRR